MDILPTIANGVAALTVMATCAVLGCEPGPDGSEPTDEAAAEPPSDVESTVEPDPEVLAIVNDREITRQQVDERLEQLDELYRHSQRPFDDSLRSERRERVIQRLIERELLRDHAEKREVEIDSDDVDRALQQRVNTKFGSSDSFRRYLDSRDMSAGDYRRRLRDQMVIETVLEREAGVDTIDEAQLRAHYERIAKRRPAAERVHVSGFTIHFDEIAETEGSDRDELRPKLVDRLDAIDDAERLEEFAAELEAKFDVHHRQRRWLEATQVRRRGADVLFDDDAPDEGIATVETSDGLDIYWVHERRPHGIRGFDEVEDLLHERARRSLLERHRRQLLEELRDDATIVVNLPRESEISEVESP